MIAFDQKSGRQPTTAAAKTRPQTDADDLPATDDEPTPTDALRLILAGDLARKHGLSLERAEMLVDRLGGNRNALEGAAQALRTRMD